MRQKLFFTSLLLFFVISGYTQDVYEIKWTQNVTQYRAALTLYSDGTGKIRVRYFNDGATRMVEQYIRKENTELGLRLTGYNPVYPGTTTKYPNYNADNFYVSQNERGELSCQSIDDAGASGKCFMRIFTTKDTKNTFLSDFNWKVN